LQAGIALPASAPAALIGRDREGRVMQLPSLTSRAFAMRILLGSALVAIAAGLAGCNTMTDDAYRVPAGPNPPPPPGYRVECTSTPSLGFLFFNDYTTGCRQIIPPVEERVVVRAKG
jgi:hypothetical protein